MGLYYSNRKLFSYANYLFYLIIGARGIGKTYSTKRFCIKKFLEKGDKFIWLRDSEEALKRLCDDTDDKESFFGNIKNDKLFKNIEMKSCYIRAGNIYVSNKYCGQLMSISTYYNIKGNDFPSDIKYVVFDEFIPEKAQKRYANRVLQFLNTIQTISRLRKDVKVILLANALDRGDEILDLFNFKPREFGYYKNPTKKAVLHFAQNSREFDKANAESVSGILTSGTMFEDNIMHNRFADDAQLLFDKRPPKSDLLCILENEDGRIRLYLKDGLLYGSRDFNPNTNIKLRYVNKMELVNTRCHLLPTTFRDKLIELFCNKQIYFENSFLKNLFVEIIKR